MHLSFSFSILNLPNDPNFKANNFKANVTRYKKKRKITIVENLHRTSFCILSLGSYSVFVNWWCVSRFFWGKVYRMMLSLSVSGKSVSVMRNPSRTMLIKNTELLCSMLIFWNKKQRIGQQSYSSCLLHPSIQDTSPPQQYLLPSCWFLLRRQTNYFIEMA